MGCYLTLLFLETNERSAIGYQLFRKHLFPDTHFSIPYDEDRAFLPSIPLLNPMTRHTMSETILLLVKDDPKQYEKTLQCLLDLVPYDGTLEDSGFNYIHIDKTY
jgi:ubiquitin carboxyl-terminal hydrolase 34